MGMSEDWRVSTEASAFRFQMKAKFHFGKCQICSCLMSAPFM